MECPSSFLAVAIILLLVFLGIRLIIFLVRFLYRMRSPKSLTDNTSTQGPDSLHVFDDPEFVEDKEVYIQKEKTKGSQSYKYLLAILVLAIIGLIINQYYRESKKEVRATQELWAKSYKERLADGDKVEEYLDKETLLYSNYTYSFSFKFPQGMDIDKGSNNHTIIRGYNDDYGVIVNVIEVNKNIYDDDKISSWSTDFSNIEREFFDKTKSNIKVIYESNTYFADMEAKFIKYVRLHKHLEKEMEFLYCYYTFFRYPYMYTIGIFTPNNVNENALNKYLNSLGWFSLLPIGK